MKITHQPLYKSLTRATVPLSLRPFSSRTLRATSSSSSKLFCNTVHTPLRRYSVTTVNPNELEGRSFNGALCCLIPTHYVSDSTTNTRSRASTRFISLRSLTLSRQPRNSLSASSFSSKSAWIHTSSAVYNNTPSSIHAETIQNLDERLDSLEEIIMRMEKMSLGDLYEDLRLESNPLALFENEVRDFRIRLWKIMTGFWELEKKRGEVLGHDVTRKERKKMGRKEAALAKKLRKLGNEVGEMEERFGKPN
ncbi:hypothetical protein BDQ17DRAFT_507565 [Cyathus striatus]|nr:hypothetical protein BDQ17DRAFT_507565 [Cyathus striatus]